MVKAHSLLYAIYICIIVALICGAMLTIASLYNQLNLYYATYDELYIHNQSLVNFALKNINSPDISPEDSENENGIKSLYEIDYYGLLPLIKAKSFIGKDTVSSTHFAASLVKNNVCLYIPNHGHGLSYSGDVALNGDIFLATNYITGSYISNKPNNLKAGTVRISGPLLPELSRQTKKVLSGLRGIKMQLAEVQKKDSLYYNSFNKPTIEIDFTSTTLANINLKGNIILFSSDSIRIDKSAHLEDVIIVSPKISFADNFSGSVQAFATQYIHVGKEVSLNYPSVLAINSTQNMSEIQLETKSSIYGSIILNGNTFETVSDNKVNIKEGCNITADIFCSGTLIIKSNISGSVYTTKIVHTTDSSIYDNCITDVKINAINKPDYFMSLPIFENSGTYGLVKRLL